MELVWLQGLYLLPAIPLAFLGYGSDNDIYQELDASRLTWMQGIPSMSRHPGYWLHESLIFVLNRAGGSLLINIVTMLVSALVLCRFWKIASRLNIQWRLPLALCLAWNPWFLIASTSGIDYVWALLFIVLSIEAQVSGNSLRAGLLGGLATGFRLGSIFTLTGAYLGIIFSQGSVRPTRHFMTAACIASVVGLLFYVPSWETVGRNLSFLQGHLGDQSYWTPKMHVGRALYKPLFLMGIIADIYVLILAVLSYRNALAALHDARGLIRASIGAVIATLILFAWYPIEYSYLLPALPFLLLVIGSIIQPLGSWQPWGLVLASVSFWFLSFALATPNVAGKASDATPGVHVERGILLNDIKERRQVIGCDSLRCYDTKSENARTNGE